VANPIVFDKLPDNLKELGQDFLRAVQILHDVTANWSETGLSDTGKEAYNNLVERFSND